MEHIGYIVEKHAEIRQNKENKPIVSAKLCCWTDRKENESKEKIKLTKNYVDPDYKKEESRLQKKPR